MKNNLHESDFYSWLNKQHQLLREKKFSQLDVENLIEEIEDLGDSKLDSVCSFLSTLITHLLKYQYQTHVLNPNLNEDIEFRSWRVTIARNRTDINRRFKRYPKLKSKLLLRFKEIYSDGKHDAIVEMNAYILKSQKRLDSSSFPDECPWTFEQMMVEGWYPKS